MVLPPTIYAIFWTASLALVLVTGALPRLGADYRLHMLGGLAAACVNCLLHTAVMIHLVGIGRSIKLAAPHLPRPGGTPPAPRRDYTAEQTRIQTRSYPISTACCVLACATAILGGARNFGSVAWEVHAGLAAALVAANLIALPWQYRLLRRSSLLVIELEGELEKVVAEMEAKGALPETMPWQA